MSNSPLEVKRSSQKSFWETFQLAESALRHLCYQKQKEDEASIRAIENCLFDVAAKQHLEEARPHLEIELEKEAFNFFEDWRCLGFENACLFSQKYLEDILKGDETIEAAGRAVFLECFFPEALEKVNEYEFSFKPIKVKRKYCQYPLNYNELWSSLFELLHESARDYLESPIDEDLFDTWLKEGFLYSHSELPAYKRMQKALLKNLTDISLEDLKRASARKLKSDVREAVGKAILKENTRVITAFAEAVKRPISDVHVNKFGEAIEKAAITQFASTVKKTVIKTIVNKLLDELGEVMEETAIKEFANTAGETLESAILDKKDVSAVGEGIEIPEIDNVLFDFFIRELVTVFETFIEDEKGKQAKEVKEVKIDMEEALKEKVIFKVQEVEKYKSAIVGAIKEVSAELLASKLEEKGGKEDAIKKLISKIEVMVATFFEENLKITIHEEFFDDMEQFVIFKQLLIIFKTAKRMIEEVAEKLVTELGEVREETPAIRELANEWEETMKEAATRELVIVFSEAMERTINKKILSSRKVPKTISEELASMIIERMKKPFTNENFFDVMEQLVIIFEKIKEAFWEEEISKGKKIRVGLKKGTSKKLANVFGKTMRDSIIRECEPAIVRTREEPIIRALAASVGKKTREGIIEKVSVANFVEDIFKSLVAALGEIESIVKEESLDGFVEELERAIFELANSSKALVGKSSLEDAIRKYVNAFERAKETIKGNDVSTVSNNSTDMRAYMVEILHAISIGESLHAGIKKSVEYVYEQFSKKILWLGKIQEIAKETQSRNIDIFTIISLNIISHLLPTYLRISPEELNVINQGYLYQKIETLLIKEKPDGFFSKEDLSRPAKIKMLNFLDKLEQFPTIKIMQLSRKDSKNFSSLLKGIETELSNFHTYLMDAGYEEPLPLFRFLVNKKAELNLNLKSSLNSLLIKIKNIQNDIWKEIKEGRLNKNFDFFYKCALRLRKEIKKEKKFYLSHYANPKLASSHEVSYIKKLNTYEDKLSKTIKESLWHALGEGYNELIGKIEKDFISAMEKISNRYDSSREFKLLGIVYREIKKLRLYDKSQSVVDKVNDCLGLFSEFSEKNSTNFTKTPVRYLSFLNKVIVNLQQFKSDYSFLFDSDEAVHELFDKSYFSNSSDLEHNIILISNSVEESIETSENEARAFNLHKSERKKLDFFENGLVFRIQEDMENLRKNYKELIFKIEKLFNSAMEKASSWHDSEFQALAGAYEKIKKLSLYEVEESITDRVRKLLGCLRGLRHSHSISVDTSYHSSKISTSNPLNDVPLDIDSGIKMTEVVQDTDHDSHTDYFDDESDNLSISPVMAPRYFYFLDKSIESIEQLMANYSLLFKWVGRADKFFGEDWPEVYSLGKEMESREMNKGNKELPFQGERNFQRKDNKLVNFLKETAECVNPGSQYKVGI